MSIPLTFGGGGGGGGGPAGSGSVQAGGGGNSAEPPDSGSSGGGGGSTSEDDITSPFMGDAPFVTAMYDDVMDAGGDSGWMASVDGGGGGMDSEGAPSGLR